MYGSHLSLLRYWRNSLVDSDRIGAEISSEAEKISAEEFDAGMLASASMERLSERFEKTEAHTNEQRIAVLLCPLQLRAQVPHGRKSAEDHAVLWIPADLTPAGELHLKDEEYPWINRALLEPSFGKNAGFAIGRLENVEKFLLDNPPELACRDWKGLILYGRRMAEAIMEESPPEHTLQNKVFIMLDKSARQASISLVELFDDIIAKKSVNLLLEKYLSMSDAPTVAAMGLDETLDQASKHCGQMSAAFALAPSQREALHHFFTLGSGEVLAVNGPPGTGKTTLLHSVIASLWVEAALQMSEPPVILAVSANNQAVTNIIDSFGGVLKNDSGDPLAERWLPKVRSYGLYFPAAGRQKKAENRFQIASTSVQFPANTGFPGIVETREYLTKATDYFLQKCGQFCDPKPSTVDAACSTLHRKLKECVQTIRQNVEREKGIVSRRNQLLHNLEAVKNRFGVNVVGFEALPDALRNAEQEIEAQEASAQSRIGAVEKEIATLSAELERWYSLQEAWQRYQSAEPFWWKAFWFLPSVKRKQQAWRAAFLHFHGLGQVPGNVGYYISAGAQSALDGKAKGRAKRNLLVEKSQGLAAQKQELRTAREKVPKFLRDLEGANKTISDLSGFLENLDITLRREAFLLATHYWEGRWLAEVKRMHELNESGRMPTGQNKMKLKLKLYAMLTPCMVATLYMLPRVLSVSSPPGKQGIYPLYGFADLLIIDEAGQVSPDLVAPAFALAKRALVVGDRHQIEPVHKILKPVDIGNLVRHRVMSGIEDLDRGYDGLKAKGIAVSSGCAMTVAQRACRFQKFDQGGKPYPERGMFLSEHYRCRDTIIDYCNRLAYNGRLEPKRGPADLPGGLPPFGYFRVLGRSQRVGGSRHNAQEAEAILQWLLAQKDRLEGLYGRGEKRVFELVAIVTPFVAQEGLLVNKLKSPRYAPLRGDGEDEIITAGTVHALQGAERSVVVFSPVRTAEDGNPEKFFFNRNKNMLNVAVSRAKDSFLVFGDLKVFQAGSQELPSRLLGEYLFSDPQSDLLSWA